MLRLALAATAFVLAGYLGRSTLLGAGGAALVWPAIGVGALWLGNGDRRSWPWDASALVLAATFVNATTGARISEALLAAIINLVQVLVFILLLRRWVPDLWAFRGSRPLHRAVDLVALVIAGAGAGLVGVVLAVPTFMIVGAEVHPQTWAVLWGRNVVALVVITAIGTVIGPLVVGAGSPRELAGSVAAGLRPRSIGHAVEAVALVGTSALLVGLIFAHSSGKPLAFLLLATSVWAGLRFSPVAVVLLGSVTGALGIRFTLAGQGPFAAIESPHSRALVAQAFVMMMVLTGLALALSRGERDAAVARASAAERSAAERARLLDAVLESMAEGVVVTETGHRPMLRNSAARSLIGLQDRAPDAYVPVEEFGLFHPNGLPLLDHELPARRALAGQVVEPQDFHVRSPNVPRGRVVEISARPLAHDDTDAPPRALVNIRDVTADRQHKDALASFAAVAAHDLFTPLTVVSGWTEVLEDEFDNGSVPAAVGMPIISRIHEATSHMRLLISDLMSYTVARDQSLQSRAVDLSTMLRTLRSLYADLPNAPVIAIDDDLVAWGDEVLLRQLFDNLIGNAVKYVSPGTRPAVALTGRIEGTWLSVRVTDNGIGIPPSQREEVFTPFHRAHQDDYRGTGLGLAICQRIVERHHGTISIEDGPNCVGSAFVVRLPLSPDATSRESKPGASTT